jgi:membrane-bound metal-dependent hydrolase YbcI (DUF457 family)
MIMWCGGIVAYTSSLLYYILLAFCTLLSWFGKAASRIYHGCMVTATGMVTLLVDYVNYYSQ